MTLEVRTGPFGPIGEWLARHKRGAKRHLIESKIADRLVTRCGRQMALTIANGMYPFEDLDFCKQCLGKAR